YEHVGPEVTRSQEGKRSQDDDKRLCLVDDLKEDILQKELMKMMTEVYYPMNEIQKMENELWNLTVKDEETTIERRWESNLRENHVQQPPPKRHNVASAYTARPREKREYDGNLPMCNKCKLHHTRLCIVKCGNCKRVGHMTKDYRTSVATTNQRAPVVNQMVTVTCYECGKQRHYQSECSKLKNQNHGNQAGNREARGKSV
ncbi:putative reverse transcriptase domain-containing protein, partial [Tanacetum coccineum]